MRRCIRFPLLLCLLALLCPQALAEASEYWPAEIPEDQVSSAAWRLDESDLQGLSVLSVSPSGRFIAVADRSSINPKTKNAAGVANPLGRLPGAIGLLERQGDHYQPYGVVSIDPEAQLELSSMIGGGCAMAWSPDETHVVLTGDWGPGSETMTYMVSAHTNLYLINLEGGDIRRLTENSQPLEHCVLPRWNGDDAVRYVRTSCEELWHNALCEMDLATGQETVLAELFSAEGRACPVFSWQVAREQLYYTVDAASLDYAGLYASPMGGGEADARCLVNIKSDLWDTDLQPYCRYLMVEVSADERWACLNIIDQRVINRDIPLSDDPQHPQDDPSNAVSTVNGRPWVPCHNVLLVDLESEQLVDPFADATLDPAKAIVTGACFAPDGQSLLCAVFGDGGPWTAADFDRTTFWQVGLADGSFPARRVFEAELAANHWFPKGFRWLEGNVLCIPTSVPPFNPVEMLQPSAFQ